MKLSHLTAALLVLSGISLYGTHDSTKLKTYGGIADGKTCSVQSNNDVVCTDGTTYKNAHKMTGSTTGTPPYLEYSNFIGSTTLMTGTATQQTRAGAGKRLMYFDGEPQKRNGTTKVHAVDKTTVLKNGSASSRISTKPLETSSKVGHLVD